MLVKEFLYMKFGEPCLSIPSEQKYSIMIKHIENYSLINKSFDKNIILVIFDDSEMKNDDTVYYNINNRT